MDKLASWHAGAPQHDLGCTRLDRINAFLNDGGNGVRCVRIEVVARTIEIHGQQEYCVETILLPIGLRLHKEHLFGEPIWSVRFFWIAVPEIFFFERHWRVFGIGADRSYCHEFLDATLPPVFHHLHAHHQIVVEKHSGICAIRANAADLSGSVNDDIGMCVLVQPPDIFVLNQVVLFLSRNEDFGGRLQLELFHDAGAEKAGPAGDNDALTFPVAHGLAFATMGAIDFGDSASRSASTIKRTRS